MPRLADTARVPARVLQRGTVSMANAFALRKIGRAPHPLAGVLSGALGRALRGTADDEEKSWILKVEAARRSLEESDEVIRTEESEWSGNPSDRGVLEETVGQCCRESS